MAQRILHRQRQSLVLPQLLKKVTAASNKTRSVLLLESLKTQTILHRQRQSLVLPQLLNKVTAVKNKTLRIRVITLRKLPHLLSIILLRTMVWPLSSAQFTPATQVSLRDRPSSNPMITHRKTCHPLSTILLQTMAWRP